VNKYNNSIVDTSLHAANTVQMNKHLTLFHYHHHHKCFTALFRDHLGEPVPEENFWTLWCKGRLTEADTQTIRTNQCPPPPSPHFLQARYSSCHPTNSVKALKATHPLPLAENKLDLL